MLNAKMCAMNDFHAIKENSKNHRPLNRGVTATELTFICSQIPDVT